MEWTANFWSLCASIGYYYEGFIAIQRAVDLQIMYDELGGTSAMQALNNTDVHLKSFPYPPYNDDPFVVVLQTHLPFIIMTSFMFIRDFLLAFHWN